MGTWVELAMLAMLAKTALYLYSDAWQVATDLVSVSRVIFVKFGPLSNNDNDCSTETSQNHKLT